MAMGQKHSLPTDEDSVLEELEQKKPSSQTSELPSETSGSQETKWPLEINKTGKDGKVLKTLFLVIRW